jgi:hypothetical protein
VNGIVHVMTWCLVAACADWAYVKMNSVRPGRRRHILVLYGISCTWQQRVSALSASVSVRWTKLPDNTHFPCATEDIAFAKGVLQHELLNAYNQDAGLARDVL